MVASRDDNKRMAKQIELDIDKIRFFFEQALQTEQNKDIYLMVFKSLWPMLNNDLEFESINELNTYYNNIALQFEFYMKDFLKQIPSSEDKNIPMQLPKKVNELFLELVNVYHLLIKHHYLVLHDKNYKNPYSEQITTLVNECKQLITYTQRIKLNEIESARNVLEKMLQNVIKRLNRGYGSIDIEGKQIELTTFSQAECRQINEINVEMNKLPESNVLNNITDKIKSKNTHPDSVAFHILQLNNYAKLINGIKVNTLKILVKYENKLLDLAQLLKENIKHVADHFSDIQQRYQVINKVYLDSLEEKGYSQSDINNRFNDLTSATQKLYLLCKAQNKEWYSIRFIAAKTDWDRIAEDLKDILEKIVQQLKKLDSPFDDSIEDFHYLTKQVNLEQKLFSELTEHDVELNNLEKKTQALLPLIEKTFDNVKEKITIASESFLQFLKSFSYRHWKALVAGAGTGAGSWATFAVLESAAIKSSLLWACTPLGVAVGLSAAAMIALTKEHFLSKKDDDKDQQTKTNPSPQNNKRP